MFAYRAEELSIDESAFEGEETALELCRLFLKALFVLQEKQPEIQFKAHKGGKISDTSIELLINGEEVGETWIEQISRNPPYEMYCVCGPFVKSKTKTYFYKNAFNKVSRRTPEALYSLCVENKFLRLPTVSETYSEAMKEFIWEYISHRLKKEEDTARYILSFSRDKEAMGKMLLGLKIPYYMQSEISKIPRIIKKIKNLEGEVEIENAKMVAELDVVPKKFDMLRHTPNLKTLIKYLEEN
jgi:hypothetical protein